MTCFSFVFIKLLAYSLVALSVLILRYQYDVRQTETTLLNDNEDITDNLNIRQNILQRLFNPKNKQPTESSSKLVEILTAVSGI